MSRSTTASFTITPRVSLRDRLAAAAALARQLDVDHTQLAAGYTTLPSGTELRVCAEAAIASGTEAELLAGIPAGLVGLANSLSGAGDRLRLERTVDLLIAADQLVVADAVAASMVELGLHTVAATDPTTTAIHGQAGPQHLLAVIAGGTVELDVVGCEGSTCEPVVDRLFELLARRGINVDELSRTSHADPEGGSLLNAAAAAARADRSTLEEGALAAHRSRSTGTPRRARTTGTDRNRTEARHG